MKTTHRDVIASLESWNLAGIVKCVEIKGKTMITYKSESQTYPHWLALQKINQIGATHVYEAEESQ